MIKTRVNAIYITISNNYYYNIPKVQVQKLIDEQSFVQVRYLQLSWHIMYFKVLLYVILYNCIIVTSYKRFEF